MIFAILVGLAAVFGLLAIRSKATFRDELWSELFWLVVATVATTFVLETVLQQDQDTRRRNADAFAFRVFTANMLRVLLKMADCDSPLGDELMESAVTGQRQFAEAAERTRQFLSTGSIREELYNQHYLDISSGLRDFARNYIRLFSSSPKEMVRNYRRLDDLAGSWEYKDGLNLEFQAYTASLDLDDKDRHKRETKTAEQLREAQRALSQTACCLAELARKVADEFGMPGS